ncbi:MAG TPA: lipid A biosynthesis acyltransferase, partial [Bacteroidia bacterium]|nr:lipid A biosynthesis acyltransferase [Bacteroidia bacterium]
MTWKGKTKGGLTGHKIFFFFLKTFGLSPAYFILYFVAFYFFIFSDTNKFIFSYFKNILGYSSFKSRLKVYRNYYLLGQTILDRVALFSGIKTNFKVVRDGGENLNKLSEGGKGGILLSAHIGNWDVAGQLLNRLNTKINILMYENEHENIKEFFDSVTTKQRVTIIPIKENDLGHLIKVKEAFNNNEFLVMHGDRFREGGKTIEHDFMGHKAKFPVGPFHLAAKFGVPVVITFAMKEGSNQYNLFATAPVAIARASTPEETEKGIHFFLHHYVTEVEKMLKRYPVQWFNY